MNAKNQIVFFLFLVSTPCFFTIKAEDNSAEEDSFEKELFKRKQLLEEEKKTGFTANERSELITLSPLLLKERTEMVRNQYKKLYEKSESIQQEVWFRYPRNVCAGLAALCAAPMLLFSKKRENDNFKYSASFFAGTAVLFQAITMGRNMLAKRKKQQSDTYGKQLEYLKNLPNQTEYESSH